MKEEEAQVIPDLVKKNRSYRRFHQDKSLPVGTLKHLVGLTRLVASAQNLQPLRYILSDTPEKNNLIFPCLRWAGYLREWPGPAEGERPVAYIVILADGETTQYVGYDVGIAAQTMLLAAVEMGFGGCMIANIQRDRLRAALNIPDRYQILLVIALGYPHETVVIEDVKGGDIKYWRDEKSVHHVPKRDLKEIILDI